MTKELDFENLFSMIDTMTTGVGVFSYEEGKDAITPLYLNEGCFRMLGYSHTEGMAYVKNVLSSILEPDRETFWQGVRNILESDGGAEFEFRTLTAQGTVRWLQVRGSLYDRENEKCVIAAVIIDTTEQKNLEKELSEQAERLSIISKSGKELIFDYQTTTDTMTIKADSKDTFSEDIVIEKYMREFQCSNIFPDDIEAYYAMMHSALKFPKHDSVDIRADYMRKGEFIWYRMDLTSLAGENGYVTRIIGRMIDINEKKIRELELESKAERDALTDLYNRDATKRIIERILAESAKDESVHAMMVIDLDGFKQMNEEFGHDKGDELLLFVKEQLCSIFKRRDVLGRIGGDEFIIFIKDIGTVSNADILATRLCRKLDRTEECGGKSIRVTGSIGVSIFPYHGTDYDALFQKADKALYSAKANGKNRYRIFDSAATMTCCNDSRAALYGKNAQAGFPRDLMDTVFQILSQDKERTSAIRSVLELVSVQFGMQRVYLASKELESQFKEGQIQFSAEGYETGDETEELREERRDVLLECFEKNGAFCIIQHYDDVSDEVCSYMQKRGIRTMVIQTISLEGGCIGFIVLERYLNGALELSEEQQEELHCVFRILSMYMLERAGRESVYNNIVRMEMLDNFDSYAYAVDADTFQIYFLNKKVAKSTPRVNVGDLCYKALQGRNSPCENCMLKKLDRQKPHDYITEEWFNYSLRVWTRATASWLECRKESPLALMNCVDISEYFIG